ncbi:cytidine deaminase-like protein [Lanmaoa asiatica]|nr:cytidine deaminase-like protein [Lanmaoa asiatica]
MSRPSSTDDHDHLTWMREALTMVKPISPNHPKLLSQTQQAEEALAAGEVPVGCVFVRDGTIIARARNRTNQLRNASRHAELEAIDLILEDTSLSPPSSTTRYPLANTTLYVTVEPCIMCASALRQLGIRRVFYGCENDKFGGCGSVLGVNERLEHPVHPSYKATGGYLREDAIMILRQFYVTENTNGPSFHFHQEIGSLPAFLFVLHTSIRRFPQLPYRGRKLHVS